MKTFTSVAVCLALILAPFVFPAVARAQDSSQAAVVPDGKEPDPAVALASALAAACRLNEPRFMIYLTADNAAAFHMLPSNQRIALMKRFSLSDDAGRPLISSDVRNHTVLRCEAPGGTVEFRFGDTRIRENLAFIPVNAVGAQGTEFGMVRESGGWRILSLGLVLLDIQQLSKQWVSQDLIARQQNAVQTLHGLADVIQTYVHAFGRLPESLAELGPAPKGQISPEQADLVNADLASGKQDGYVYRYTILPAPNGLDPSFELAATPEQYGKSGYESYFLDADGKVHGADKHGTVATQDDPLVPAEKTQ